jgi:hypothetical protein
MLGAVLEMAHGRCRNEKSRTRHAKFLGAWSMAADYAPTKGMGTVCESERKAEIVV